MSELNILDFDCRFVVIILLPRIAGLIAVAFDAKAFCNLVAHTVFCFRKHTCGTVTFDSSLLAAPL